MIPQIQTDFSWCKNVILSCVNPDQLRWCDNLIFNFMQKYGSEGEAKVYYNDLLTAISEKDVSLSVDA